MSCICQRAYETGFTGLPAADRWLARRYELGSLDRSFFRGVYHWIESLADQGRAEPSGEEEGFSLRQYRRIEEACTAPVHYPTLDLHRSEVFTIFDSERIAEDEERYELALCVTGGGRWYDQGGGDYDAATVAEAVSNGKVTDVLTYQRLSKADKRAVDLANGQ